MIDLKITAELVDPAVTRRLIGNHLNLLDEERKRESYMDRIFTGAYISIISRRKLMFMNYTTF